MNKSVMSTFKRNSIEIVLLILFIFLQHRLIFGKNSLGDLQRIHVEVTELKKIVGNMQDANNEIRENIKNLDLKQYESIARRELGFIKKGETYYNVE